MSGFEREAFDEEIRSTLKAVDRGIANLKESAPTIGRTSRPRSAALLLAVTACAPPARRRQEPMGETAAGTSRLWWACWR